MIEAEGLPEQRVLHRELDIRGLVREEVSAYETPDAITTRYEYDLFGNQTHIIDPRGIELAESDTQWAQSQRQALGYSQFASGLTTDPDQRAELLAMYTSTQQFDVLNRKTGAIDPLGGTTTTEYDVFGNIVKSTDPNGSVGYFFYDKLNRLQYMIDPNGYVVETIYDSNSNVRDTIKYTNPIVGQYDETSTLQILDTEPGTPPADPYIVRDSVHDQLTHSEYDTLNRLRQTQDAEGYTELYEYDALGNVQRHINKNQHEFIYEYDANSNLIYEYLPVDIVDDANQPHQVINHYVYDALGNRTQGIKGDGLPEQLVTNYVFDKLSRQREEIKAEVSIYNPDTQLRELVTPTTSIEYDARGNIIKQTDPNGNDTYHYYDAHNRRIATVNAERYLQTYDIDAAGNIVAQRKYEDPLPLDYDLTVTPDPVSIGGSFASSYRENVIIYDANNRIIESRTSVVATFDHTNGLATEALVSRNVYDNKGNLVQVIDAIGVSSGNETDHSTFLYYDKVGNQIAQVDPLGYVTAWEYDGNSNLVRETTYERAISATSKANLTTSSNPVELILEVSQQEGLLAESSQNQSEPSVVYDAQGNALAIWIENGDVYSSRFIPGQGWQSEESFVIDDGTAIDTHLAMDGSGNAVAVWAGENAGVITLFSNVYIADDGWQGAQGITLPSGTVTDAALVQLSMNQTGDAAIAWSHKSVDNSNAIYTSHFDTMTGWTAAAQIDNGHIPSNDLAPTKIALSVNSTGDFMAVWTYEDQPLNSLISFNTYENGVGWNVANDYTYGSPIKLDELIANPEGGFSLLWHDGVHLDRRLGVDNFQLGMGWEGPEILRISTSEISTAQLAFDQNGNAIAIWQQSGLYVYGSVKVLGSNWQPATELGRGSGYNLEMVMSSSGNAVALWQGRYNNAILSVQYLPDIGWSNFAIHDSTSLDFIERPTMAIDGQGKVMLMGLRNQNGINQINYNYDAFHHNRIIDYEYDALNQLKTKLERSANYSIVDSSLGDDTQYVGTLATKYEYDGLGNRTFQYNPINPQTTLGNTGFKEYQYDALGRLSAEFDKTSRINGTYEETYTPTRYEYNGTGQLIKKDFTYYTYNTAGEVISQLPKGSHDYFYDAAGAIRA